MALTGLQIYKLLPRTNCRECGQATCLAFAMQLAAGKASLNRCPYAGQEAHDALNAANKPPIITMQIGEGSRAAVVGGETVLFRHDKRFVNPTALGITVSDEMCGHALLDKVRAINELSFDRMGQLVGVNLIGIRHSSPRKDDFLSAVRVVHDNSPLPLVLMALGDTTAMEAGLELVSGERPLLYAATEDDWETVSRLALRHQVPLVVAADGLARLAPLVEKVAALGIKDIVLDSMATNPGRMVVEQTQMRRLALARRLPAFGYPAMHICRQENSMEQIMTAALAVAKYAAVVMIDTDDPAEVLPLVTLRLNLYTDPQKPITVESKVYEVGRPGPGAPVFITTNFSLTYYCVLGDIEATRIGAYVLPIDTDGTSVLTAWAAGKMTPEKIASFIHHCGIAERVRHRKLIIPGGLAAMRDEIHNACGWEVMVGPAESSAIPRFLRTNWTGEEDC